jgi:zinc/manganese transport system ATP-binding protein
LIKGLAGLMKPDSGKMIIAPDAKIAYLPQLAELDCDFPMTVLDLVLAGLWEENGNFGKVSSSAFARVEQALATVGLAEFTRRNLDTLSGGQRQRALFARLIVQDANIILLDEPFNAMDERTTRDLTHLIHHWVAEGRTVIAVLHDLQQVKAYFSQCVLLAREQIAWGETASVLTPGNWDHANHLAEGWNADAPVCLTENAA